MKILRYFIIVSAIAMSLTSCGGRNDQPTPSPTPTASPTPAADSSRTGSDDLGDAANDIVDGAGNAVKGAVDGVENAVSDMTGNR